ncbi:MAG: hypothetical protein PHS07_03920 [Patescibacteria group bacterium]|nr:hypothetical protein [Patescibacteria group bacterium]
MLALKIKNKSSQYILLGVILLFLCLGLFFIFPNLTQAKLVDSVIKVLGWISYPFLWLIGKLVVLIMGLVIQVAQYNDFINSPAVTKGWMIVRDICNMFFILLLLLIAFSTVLGIKKYNYKNMLGRVVLAAIMINFSKLICGLFIDFAQVIMLTFVNAFKGAAAGNLTQAIGLADMLSFNPANQQNDLEGISLFGSLILAQIMLSITLCVVVVMLLVLVFRIVMIWIFVVLSPMAFLMSAFPSAKEGVGTIKWVTQWWSEFSKYVMVGPILAFFLWLSLTIMATHSNTPGGMGASFQAGTKPQNQGYASPTNQGQGNLNAAITEIGSSEKMLSFIISIAMLVGGLMATQQMGGVLGNVATKTPDLMKKGGKSLAVWGGKRADMTQMKVQKWAGQKIQSSDKLQRFQGLQKIAGKLEKPTTLRPSIHLENAKRFLEEKEKMNYGQVRADNLDKMFKIAGGQKTNYGDREFVKQVIEKARELDGMDSSQIQNIAETSKNPIQRMGGTLALHMTGQEGGLITSAGYRTDREGRQKYIQDKIIPELGLARGGMFAAMAAEHSRKNGITPGSGLFVYDENEGRHRATTEEEQKKYIQGAFGPKSPEKHMVETDALSLVTLTQRVKDSQGNNIETDYSFTDANGKKVSKQMDVADGIEENGIKSTVWSMDFDIFKKIFEKMQTKDKAELMNNLDNDSLKQLDPQKWAYIVNKGLEMDEKTFDGIIRNNATREWNKIENDPYGHLNGESYEKLKNSHQDWSSEKILGHIMKNHKDDAGYLKQRDLKNFEDEANKILSSVPTPPISTPTTQTPVNQSSQAPHSGNVNSGIDSYEEHDRKVKRASGLGGKLDEEGQLYKNLLAYSGGYKGSVNKKDSLVQRIIDMWSNMDGKDYSNDPQKINDAEKKADELIINLQEKQHQSFDTKAGEEIVVNNITNNIGATANQNPIDLSGLQAQFSSLEASLSYLASKMGATQSAKKYEKEFKSMAEAVKFLQLGDKDGINQAFNTNYEKKPTETEIKELMEIFKKRLRLTLGGVDASKK